MSTENETAADPNVKETKADIAPAPKKKSSKLFLIVVLILFGLFLAGYYHDQNLLPDKRDKAFQEAGKMAALSDKPTMEQVKEAIGVSPSKRPDVEGYQVERYTLRRYIPIAESEFIEAVYKDGKLVKITQNKAFDPNAQVEYRSPDPKGYSGKEVQMGFGGGGGNSGGDDSDDDEDDNSEDGDGEESSEEK